MTKLDSEVLELTTATTLQATELNALRDTERVLREDLNALSVDGSQDEIVKRAWKVRDDTIARKKTVEIELAKVRIELMHVNSQLLETIQQKVELSQQLEQWQVSSFLIFFCFTFSISSNFSLILLTLFSSLPFPFSQNFSRFIYPFSSILELISSKSLRFPLSIFNYLIF